MLKIVALYFCWAIILASGTESSTGQTVGKSSIQVEKNVELPIEPSISTEPTPKTTTAPTTTTTVTPSTTTTSTTVTPDPKTTTPAPAPSPPTPPANTTTPAPTPKTTTPTPVTTTPVPVSTTPVPAPKDGTWIVNGTNATCIVIRMAVQFNVTYITNDNKTQHKLLTLPTEAASTNVTGVCGDNEQMVNITWHAGNDSLNIHFVKDEKTKRYSMHHVELYLGSHEFPDGASDETLKFVHEADQFPTGMTSSYRCMKLQKLDLTRDGTNSTVGSIEISDLQFQAFKTDKASTFSSAQDCSPDVPDVVPIAVGCALTALVIVILAAYLVGRRRSQARGYLSM